MLGNVGLIQNLVTKVHCRRRKILTWIGLNILQWMRQRPPTTDLHLALGLVMRSLIDFIMLYIELKAFASVTKKRFVYKKRNFERPCYCY